MPPAPKASVLKGKAKLASEHSTTKTLTPQRKHRKLLKDGSSEVWPESIETIFVEGLRRYWQSPWATYSRGRSRWRNQYLVEYLHKAGVERTKKQVASHIQVLRNMWKGEPEFHLVAGGDELFLDGGPLAPVKAECDTNTLITLDLDDRDAISPISPSTPGLSATNFVYEHSPDQSSHSSASSFGSGFQLNLCAAGSSDCAPSPVTPPQYPNNGILRPRTYSEPLTRLVIRPPLTSPLSSAPSSPAGQSGVLGCSPETECPSVNSDHPILSTHLTMHRDQKRLIDNKLCFVSLWTEGMLPLTVPSDGVPLPAIRPLEPLIVRIRLHLASIDDTHCSPTLHGFQGTVSLASPWQFSAQCITKVYANGACIIDEVGNLQLAASSAPTANGSHMVQAFLPESPLSRSRWLDASLQTFIMQQIVVDQVTLAFIIYDLDRKDTLYSPAAHLQGIQRYRAQDGLLPTSGPSSPYQITPGQISHVPFIPRLIRRSESTSLSCALIPNNNLASLNSSLLC